MTSLSTIIRKVKARTTLLSKAALRLPVVVLALCSVATTTGDSEAEAQILQDIERSGRLGLIGISASERLKPIGRLAPGDPPMLAFRYLEDRRRHRFGELDLMMDDAGH